MKRTPGKGRNWERQHVLGRQPVWEVVLVSCLENWLGDVVGWWRQRHSEWFRELLWISLLIPRVLNQLIWNIPEPKVKDNHLWLLNSETMDSHQSQTRGMFLWNSIMVLNSMANMKCCPQPNKSPPLMAHCIDCVSGLRMMSVGQKAMFHMMYDRNLLERLHLITLAPPSWHKTTVCTGAYSRSAVVEWVVCKLALKQSQHSWLGNAEVLELDGGPFEEEIHEEIQQQRRRVWSEINLGKVLGLLINDTTFHKHGISPGYLISHNRLTNQLFPYRTT